jgi:transcriptional regulator with PAS, ATPase and Fis domain
LVSREELDKQYDFAGVVGKDPKLLQLLQILGRVSATDASVLITGESGTGKEVIADAIHRNSTRKNKPLVKVNLGSIPSSLFESELFGHVKVLLRMPATTAKAVLKKPTPAPSFWTKSAIWISAAR